MSAWLGPALSIGSTLLGSFLGGDDDDDSSRGSSTTTSTPAYEQLVRGLIDEYLMPRINNPLGQVTLDGFAMPVYDPALANIQSLISSIAGVSRTEGDTITPDQGDDTWSDLLTGDLPDNVGNLFDQFTDWLDNGQTPTVTDPADTPDADIFSSSVTPPVTPQAPTTVGDVPTIKSQMLSDAFATMRDLSRTGGSNSSGSVAGSPWNKITPGNTPGMKLG